MRNLAADLSDIGKKCDGLLDKASMHLHNLAEQIDDPSKHDSKKIRSEHEELENEIAAFIKKFREIKKENFAVAEQVIEKEVKRLNP